MQSDDARDGNINKRETERDRLQDAASKLQAGVRELKASRKSLKRQIAKMHPTDPARIAALDDLADAKSSLKEVEAQLKQVRKRIGPQTKSSFSPRDFFGPDGRPQPLSRERMEAIVADKQEFQSFYYGQIDDLTRYAKLALCGKIDVTWVAKAKAKNKARNGKGDSGNLQETGFLNKFDESQTQLVEEIACHAVNRVFERLRDNLRIMLTKGRLLRFKFLQGGVCWELSTKSKTGQEYLKRQRETLLDPASAAMKEAAPAKDFKPATFKRDEFRDAVLRLGYAEWMFDGVWYRISNTPMGTTHQNGRKRKSTKSTGLSWRKVALHVVCPDCVGDQDQRALLTRIHEAALKRICDKASRVKSKAGREKRNRLSFSDLLIRLGVRYANRMTEFSGDDSLDVAQTIYAMLSQFIRDAIHGVVRSNGSVPMETFLWDLAAENDEVDAVIERVADEFREIEKDMRKRRQDIEERLNGPDRSNESPDGR